MQNLQTYVLLPNKLPLTCFGNILPETGNLVGFFVGMGPDVDFKGGNLTETPVTQITFVWFLAGVDSKVLRSKLQGNYIYASITVVIEQNMGVSAFYITPGEKLR
ncbi:unnamed protein product [Allacma fusca]|uniref:Uncharacterized protein n=1 Tax=Allacma fusca TaxID=39272 RepID=A0A8J2K3D8_9HEXA|nr:unnamed protein product [Allacma fusca]